MLTKEQLSELICKHSERENGLQRGVGSAADGQNGHG